ncbi:MAG: MogA/MoaB family molybdenum cofactor biosynthesis protein [Candidatus Xenobia bacterium]
MSDQLHKKAAPKTVAVWVITVSDTRTAETDSSGDLIVSRFQEGGHQVVGRGIVRDDAAAVRAVLQAVLHHPEVQAVVLNGGTGISRRDGTYEVVCGFLEKKLDGFGEIFRFLSFEQVGSAAIMSRAVAGTANGRLVISIPGSPKAGALAMDRLILPEIGHMVFEVNR